MASIKQTAANKRNAKLSTGPISEMGKSASSGNARAHGILSKELVLPGESETEYGELLSRLIGELGAVGTLEMALVERISVSIWRQKRIIRAERDGYMGGRPLQALADKLLDRSRSIAAPIRKARHELKTQEAIIFAILGYPPYRDQLDKLEREVHLLRSARGLTVRQYPLEFALLSQLMPVPDWVEPGNDAKSEIELTHGQFDEYCAQILAGIGDWRNAPTDPTGEDDDERPIEQLAMPANMDQILRYQSALDNDWYKAMRALREAQSARMKTISATAVLKSV